MASRAAVRPRFVSPSTGDVLTLEESVAEAVRHFRHGIIEVAGPPGSGKTQALRHLQAVLPSDLQVDFQTATDAPAAAVGRKCVVLEVAWKEVEHPGRILRFDLAPWGIDEIIEYCLTRYHEQCPALPRRIISAPDLDQVMGNAELTSLVIDCFADDPELQTVVAAFQTVIDGATQGDLERLPINVQLLCGTPPFELDAEGRVVSPRLQQLLRHASFRSTAVAMQLAAPIEAGDLQCIQDLALLRLLDQYAVVYDILSGMLSEKGIDTLRQVLELRSHVAIHPTMATLLHRCDPDWRPRGRSRPRLRGAQLRMAHWPEIDLRRYDLCRVDLSGACLERSLLIGADAEEARFSEAMMSETILRKIKAPRASFRNCHLRGCNASQGIFRQADFSGAVADGARFDAAVLRHANLTDASFCKADLRKAGLSWAVLDQTDLTEADLSRANLRGVDFRTAILDRTVLEKAELLEAVFEGVVVESIQLRDAILRNALMTSSVLPQADLRGACLSGAYLAEVRWPGANLRGAKLTGATFHMGSSRSGLVSSDLASEGTRTGFYTDDYDDHHFRSPEEIRTADLTCCDLRGAKIDGVDFWRVDVRGARASSDQWKQLIATGAIVD